jgi:hypothetical protein
VELLAYGGRASSRREFVEKKTGRKRTGVAPMGLQEEWNELFHSLPITSAREDQNTAGEE